MQESLRDWYIILSRVSAALSVPVSELSGRIDLPLASAFLFGLVGAVAPCQLSTNTSAIAHGGGAAGGPRGGGAPKGPRPGPDPARARVPRRLPAARRVRPPTRPAPAR